MECLQLRVHDHPLFVRLLSACFRCPRLTSLTLTCEWSKYRVEAYVDVALPRSYPPLPSPTQLHLSGELGTETHALPVLAACPAVQSIHLCGVYLPNYPQPTVTIATMLSVGRLCRRLSRLEFERFSYDFFLPTAEQLQQVMVSPSSSSLASPSSSSATEPLFLPRLTDSGTCVRVTASYFRSWQR